VRGMATGGPRHPSQPQRSQGRPNEAQKEIDQVTTPTKEQVIAAVEAEIDPSTPGAKRIKPKPVALIALRQLARQCRISRRDQERLFWFVESVWQAIKRGDDPGRAYDAAMASAPPDRQASPRKQPIVPKQPRQPQRSQGHP
jgi:hypothetical protein